MVGDAGWGLLLPFRVGQGIGGLGALYCKARMAQWFSLRDKVSMSMSVCECAW